MDVYLDNKMPGEIVISKLRLEIKIEILYLFY